jgi:ABC-type phosphate transport system ATPase subunit
LSSFIRSSIRPVELKDDGKDRTGAVVEYAETDKIFTNPDDKRTEDYVTGKFG